MVLRDYTDEIPVNLSFDKHWPSAHPANPTRSYQSLRHFDESPQLPYGYASMIVWAYVPYLWRRRMDHRVLRHYAGDITLTNLQPSKRLHYLKQYGGNSKTF